MVCSFACTGHRRRTDQHEDVEMMFETYLKQVNKNGRDGYFCAALLGALFPYRLFYYNDGSPSVSVRIDPRLRTLLPLGLRTLPSRIYNDRVYP